MGIVGEEHDRTVIMQKLNLSVIVLFLVYGVQREFRDQLAICFKLTLSHVIEEETEA